MSILSKFKKSETLVHKDTMNDEFNEEEYKESEDFDSEDEDYDEYEDEEDNESEFSPDEYEKDESKTDIPERIQTEMPEDDDLSLYFNRVNIQGRLYFKDELKVSDTKIGGHVASFNLLIKKKSKNGPKKHKIYIKTYNLDAIEWLENQNNWTWIKIEGSLEVAGGKNYVNAKTITALSREQLIAMNTSNDITPLKKQNISDEIPDDIADIKFENNDLLRKLKEIQRQNTIIQEHSKMFVSSDNEDESVALVTVGTELKDRDILDIKRRTKKLLSDSYDFPPLYDTRHKDYPYPDYDRNEDTPGDIRPKGNSSSRRPEKDRLQNVYVRKTGGYYNEEDDLDTEEDVFDETDTEENFLGNIKQNYTNMIPDSDYEEEELYKPEFGERRRRMSNPYADDTALYNRRRDTKREYEEEFKRKPQNTVRSNTENNRHKDNTIYNEYREPERRRRLKSDEDNRMNNISVLKKDRDIINYYPERPRRVVRRPAKRNDSD